MKSNSADVIADEQHSDDRSLRIFESGNGVRSVLIPVTVGTTYYAETWFNGEAAAKLGFYLEFWTSSEPDFENASNRIETYNVFNPSSEWSKTSIVAEAPEGAQFLTITLYRLKGNSGTVYMEDVKVYEHDAALGIQLSGKKELHLQMRMPKCI